ncbi:unnamed protein product [Symbiodinium natans]|uniref:Uncharacterized protein n=1 Tax=Symbiodinium natans TaxID=878477 RepID=A0A812TCW5_9DINO|nr:unnamed protein product [Symbiodinium natans]
MVERGAVGCSGLGTARLRLIEPGEDGTFGEAGPTDRCRFGAETSLQAGPANCGPGGLPSGVAPFNCQLEPLVATTAGWRWDLELRPRLRARAALPTALGVGSLTAEPLLLKPARRAALEVEDLRLEAPGGSFDTTAPHILKLIADDAGTLQESDCSSATPEPERLSLRCSAEGCPSADQVAPEVLVWQRVEISQPGWYAACYCQVTNATTGCQEGSWRLLGWQLVAGITSLAAGSEGQGSVVYRGGHFLLTLRGAGFTPEDRLHIQAGEVACMPWMDYQASAASAPVALAAGASEEPTLPGSLAPGEMRSFSREGLRGRLSLTRAHGLQAGDTLRFAGLVVVGPACASVYSVALDRNVSDCLEVLESAPINVFSAPSETEVVLDVALSEEELQSLDLSLATWLGASAAAFGRFAAGRSATGRHAVCWGGRDANFSSLASILEVVDAPPFPSALHLTTALPHVPAPSVLAFQTNGAAPYSEAAGPMRLTLTFRSSGPLRHAFSAADESAALALTYDQAAQEVCGRLFRELWSEDEDGFPQPAGCYYSDALAEYGMVFPARAGLKPGTRYQIVMMTRLSRGISTQHDWMLVSDTVPLPVIGPEETRYTSPQSFGDLGALPSLLACQEACAQVLQCNVAVYRLSSDQHCLIADFSQRAQPFATQPAPGNLTLFVADRLNGTAQDSQSVVADLWSMDDMLTRPFHAVEASETILAARAAAAVLPSDPRWHTQGLMVLDPDGIVTTEAAPLLLTQPRLALQLRAAQGSSIEAGTLLRLFLRPLTQWALPEEGCPVHCVPQSVALSCDAPACHAVALVSAPWEGQRNVLEIVLPPNMDKITDTVMHTIVLSGPTLHLPAGGFMPSRLSAELIAPGTEDAAERRVSYMESVGVLPYAALAVVGGVLARDGAERPFAGDVSNSIYFRFKLGSTLLSGSLQAAFTVQLPAGYVVRSVNVAPPDLVTLSSRRLSGPQSRGQLTAGTWSCATRTCTFTMDSHAAIYSGYVVVHLVVDNPAIPLKLQDTANRWSMAVSGPGDAASLAVLPARTLEPGTSSDQALYTPSSAVLGRLSEISLTPTNFWQGAARSMARVFFRTQQGWAGRVALQLTAPSSGFGFDAACTVEDLPASYYLPQQSLLGRSSSAEQGASQGTVRRLPKVEACHGVHVSTLQPPESDWLAEFYALPGRLPSHAEILAEGPLIEAATYAFAILVRHTNSFQPSAGGFMLASYIHTEASWQLLDRSPAPLPLLPATASDTWPGYGLYLLAAPDGLSARVVPRLPFAQTALPGEVLLLLRPPVTSAWLAVSWRVFAPTTYGWDFTDRAFFFRQSEVPGTTADLPVIRAPTAPHVPPLNALIFYGANENPTPGWVVNETYGFRAGVQVPTQTPRHAVNEWIVEWGFDRIDLSERLAAATAHGEEVRAVHSFNVWSLGGSIQGQSGELLLEFGLVSEVPQIRGALQLRTPQGYVFDTICVPFPPAGSFEPFLPLPVRVECTAATSGTDPEPVLTIRPMDGSLPPGRWCFLLTTILPAEVTAADADPVFTLRTFSSYAVEAIDQPADVGAVTAGFRAGQRLPFAGIVDNVDYRLSGRDDHPGRASALIFGFQLRTAPNVIGNVEVEVVAPLGYLFNEDCVADISDRIFGVGQGFPAPYRPFEPGVVLVACAGHRNVARLEVTPGLLPGTLYAFKLRIDQQPAATPAQNIWFLNIADQASQAIEGYSLWSFTDLALALLLQTIMPHTETAENEVTILFRPTKTMTSQGALHVTAPEGFRIRRVCTASVQQLASGSGLAQTPADVELPGVVCQGERPATNRFEVSFLSQLSLLAGGCLAVQHCTEKEEHLWVLWNEVDKGMLGDYAARAHVELEIRNFQDHDGTWPFSDQVCIWDLFSQVSERLDGWEECCHFWCHKRRGRVLRSLGVGSSQKRQKSAALLGLLVASRLLEQREGPWLEEELRLARKVTFPRIQPSQQQPLGCTQAGRPANVADPSMRHKEAWIPMSGSWIWWYDPYLLVLCEDSSSSLFADARPRFQHVAEVDSCKVLKEDQAWWLKDWLESRFPEAYSYAGIYKFQGYQVIGMGGTVEHRMRAACVGLGMLMCKDRSSLPRQWQPVWDEVQHAQWLPTAEIQRFYDLPTQGFWQNIEGWHADRQRQCPDPLMCDHLKPSDGITSTVLEELLRSCQPALRRQLQLNGNRYTQLDLTHSGRPWHRIIAGHSEMEHIVGPGITHFAVAADPRRLNPFHGEAAIYWVARRVDQSLCAFSCMKRTHDTWKKSRTKQDETMAFRLATGWQVAKRWEGGLPCVFVNLIQAFKESCNVGEEDFVPPGSNGYDAWTLSEETERKFRDWLQVGRPCQELTTLRRSVTSPELQQVVEEAMQDCDGDLPDSARSTRRSPGLRPLWWQLLKDVLQETTKSRMLWQLDPSRNPAAEGEYSQYLQWHKASETLFAHEAISDHFIHGRHEGVSVATTIQQIVDGVVRGEDFPALVAISWRGNLHIICGNRRLYAFKEASRRTGREIWFKAIVHDFPRLTSIPDEHLRWAFKIKAVAAMNTDNFGMAARMRGARG